MTSTPLPDDVRIAVDRYLVAVDRGVPGLVGALLVTGSVALGDYQPEISDVDLVALCRNAPTPDEHAALEVLHRPSRPNVDVLYATRADLLGDPSTLSLPGSVDGVYRGEGAFVANPVEWRVLATSAIAVRGVGPAPEELWFDAGELRRWNLANLDTYWSDWVKWAGTVDGTEARVRSEYGLQWLVLGVPRLHYTIATLDVTSKSGAGRYTLEVAPAEWRAVLETALALRVDRNAPLPATTDTLWRDAIDLSAWFIADAHRLADTASR